MAELDPNIPLSSVYQGPTAEGMMRLQQAGLDLAQKRKAAQEDAAITKLFQAPGARDPSGTLSLGALNQLYAISPQKAMAIQEEQMRMQEGQLKRQAQLQEFVAPVRSAALKAYDDAKAKGLPEEAANAAGQAELDKSLPGIEPLLSPQEAQGLQRKFDRNTMYAREVSYQDQLKLKEQERRDNLADRREGRMEQHQERMEELANKRLDIGLGGGSDPKKQIFADWKNEFARVNGRAPNAQEMTDQLAKLNQVNSVRSGEAAIIQKAQQDWSAIGKPPDAAKLAEIRGAAKSLSKVQDNLTMTASAEDNMLLNMEIARQEQAKAGHKDLAPILKNWVLKGEEALGDPDVPAYEAAIVTVANEYAKIASGSFGSAGATVSSREEAAKIINKALTSGGLDNVFKVLNKEADNRKASYQKQYNRLQGIISPAKASDPTAGKASYESPADAAAAFQAGKLSREDLAKLIKDKGW